MVFNFNNFNQSVFNSINSNYGTKLDKLTNDEKIDIGKRLNDAEKKGITQRIQSIFLSKKQKENYFIDLAENYIAFVHESALKSGTSQKVRQMAPFQENFAKEIQKEAISEPVHTRDRSIKQTVGAENIQAPPPFQQNPQLSQYLKEKYVIISTNLEFDSSGEPDLLELLNNAEVVGFGETHDREDDRESSAHIINSVYAKRPCIILTEASPEMEKGQLKYIDPGVVKTLGRWDIDCPSIETFHENEIRLIREAETILNLKNQPADKIQNSINQIVSGLREIVSEAEKVADHETEGAIDQLNANINKTMDEFIEATQALDLSGPDLEKFKKLAFKKIVLLWFQATKIINTQATQAMSTSFPRRNQSMMNHILEEHNKPNQANGVIIIKSGSRHFGSSMENAPIGSNIKKGVNLLYDQLDASGLKYVLFVPKNDHTVEETTQQISLSTIVSKNAIPPKEILQNHKFSKQEDITMLHGKEKIERLRAICQEKWNEMLAANMASYLDTTKLFADYAAVLLEELKLTK